jgi:hypothetical protein
MKQRGDETSLRHLSDKSKEHASSVTPFGWEEIQTSLFRSLWKEQQTLTTFVAFSRGRRESDGKRGRRDFP